MACRKTFLASLVLVPALASCAPVEPAPEPLARLGRFEVLAASAAMRGVTLGVPHADRTPFAVAVARAAHSTSGAGVVLAHGYVSRDLVVNAPVEGKDWVYSQLAHTARARAVYREYVRTLRLAAGGAMGLHVDLREVEGGTEPQVVTTGLAREEAARIRAIRLGAASPRVHPIDSMNYDGWIVRNDGVLLIAPRGLAIRLPRGPSAEETARWLRAVIASTGPVTLEAPGRAEVLDRGRFTLLPRASRVVVAAPHGSGDSFTDEVAERIAERLGASLVVVHGFMGTRERANADRIAVNRPLEGAGIHTTDKPTPEAAIVYAAYLAHAKAVTAWPPSVYIEIHCNARPDVGSAIEIATVGVPLNAARSIKQAYREAAARARLEGVAIRVEHDDTVRLNAFGAKQVGILGQVPLALHIELPYAAALKDPQVRVAYADLLAQVLARSLPRLGSN